MRSDGFGMNCIEFRYINSEFSVGRMSASDAIIKDLVKPYFRNAVLYSKKMYELVGLLCTCKLNYNKKT